MSNKQGYTWMAWGGGKDNSQDSSTSFDVYEGIDPVTIMAVNPTAAEMEKIFGNKPKEEPVYIGESNGVGYVRITFVLNNPTFEKPIMVPFFLRNEGKISQAGKRKVMDIYGRTAWVTPEELSSHAIPLDKNGNPCRISNNYTPCYNGQEELVNFLRAYSGIPKVEKFENNQYVGLIDNPEDAEVTLLKINDYFKGDVSELKEIIGYNPNNRVRVCLYKRENGGRYYQAIFVDRFENPNVKSDEWFVKEIAKQQEGGKYQGIEFWTGAFKKFEVKPTDFSAPVQAGEDENPWA